MGADLVGTLSGNGPFTVFAPTNDAFAALPKGVLTNLLKPENKQYLVDLLTYHVASGDVRSKDLSDGQQITTVNGEVAEVSISGGHVMIGAPDAELDDAKVTAADIAASNGVVHVIDAVMTYSKFEEHWLEHSSSPPPPAKSIVDLAVATPHLSTLVTALQAADLVGTLSGNGPFTVFAPTNDAFAALPKGVLTNLLKPENKQYLVDLLTYHVASGDVRSKD